MDYPMIIINYIYSLYNTLFCLSVYRSYGQMLVCLFPQFSNKNKHTHSIVSSIYFFLFYIKRTEIFDKVNNFLFFLIHVYLFDLVAAFFEFRLFFRFYLYYSSYSFFFVCASLNLLIGHECVHMYSYVHIHDQLNFCEPKMKRVKFVYLPCQI